MATIGPGARRTGRVKFFNSVKGYGFIIPHHQEPGEHIEIFVHHTAIYNNGGFKSLAEGEEVEYDLMQGPKGMQASQVTGPGGTSVKGDPNAGKQHRLGHYPGFGSGGHGGYMQAYSQPYSAGQQMRQAAAQYGMAGGGPAGGPVYGTSLYGMYGQPQGFGGVYSGNAAHHGLFSGAAGVPASNQSSPASAGFPAAQPYGAGQPPPVCTQAAGGSAGGILGAGPYHRFYGLHANPPGFYAGAGGGGPGGGGQQQQPPPLPPPPQQQQLQQ